MRLLLLLLIPPLILFALALLLLRLPWPEALHPHQNLIVAITVGVLGLVYVAGVAWYVIDAFVVNSRVLDPAFAALGFSARPHLPFQRRYDGQFQGRAVQATYAPPSRNGPAVLHLYVSTSLSTRLAASAGGPLQIDCRNCQPCELSDDLAAWQVHAADPAWATALLNESAVRQALPRLLGRPGETIQGELYLQPGTFWLRLHAPRSLPTEQVQPWLNDLLIIVQAAEELPAPGISPP
jgi:hypothetical protein